MREKLTIDEFAELWRLPRWTAYRLVRREDFPALKVGRQWLIDPEGAEQWWNRRIEEEIS